jgi:hypothetical protein
MAHWLEVAPQLLKETMAAHCLKAAPQLLEEAMAVGCLKEVAAQMPMGMVS